MIHAAFWAFVGFVGAHNESSTRVRLDFDRDVNPETVAEVMIFCSVFGFIGGIWGGKYGWGRFHHIYSAKLSGNNRLHLAAFVILGILVLLATVQMIRIAQM